VQLSQDPANGPPEFADALECDPGLVSQILAFVNSSFFGLSQKVCDVRFAITLVGIKAIRGFVLWNAVFHALPKPKCASFKMEALWQDSLRRGLFARAVAELMQISDVEECFTAALLQDMAVPLLVEAEPDAYGALLESRAERDRRLSQLEWETFGWTHAEAAHVVARRWGLPNRLAALVESHVAIGQCLTRLDQEPSRAAVALSSLLPAAIDPVWTEGKWLQSCCQKVLVRRGTSLQRLLERVDSEYAVLATFMRLPEPRQPLAAAYGESDGGRH
jgi:HD-like signal output (HDOD) protein